MVCEAPAAILELRMSMPLSLLRPLLAAGVALAILPTTVHGKCRELPSQPILPGYVYVLDGRVVGTFDMNASPPHPPAEEILVVQVACKRATDSEIPGARRAAVMVATRTGARALLTRTLNELAGAMAGHRAATGAFAADLEEIDFFDSRMTLPIVLETAGDRWGAVAQLDGGSVTCSADGRADGRAARVRCD